MDRPIVHGASRYGNHHCRCTICRAGWAATMRVQKAKRRRKGLCLDCCRRVRRYVRCTKHREQNRLSTRAWQARQQTAEMRTT